MTKVWLRAPGKINWSLEVLGKRADGYHEIRSLMQTISLGDQLSFETADELTLRVYGGQSFRRRPQETNLAFQAAQLLGQQAGVRSGAHITLWKHIPIAAGLGGGSSDAAATLRGLRALWQLDIPNDVLASLAAEIGSDVPFFLRGGTALVSGRGEEITPLPDSLKRGIAAVWPPRRSRPNKTARMYAALRPEHYSDGSRTERLAARLRDGQPIRDEDVCDVFEAVLPEVDSEGAAVFRQAREAGGWPHLCGSGPAFFFLLEPEQPAEPLLASLQRLGLPAAETHSLSAAEAVASEAVS